MKRNLTAASVKNARPRSEGRTAKLSDGGGLFLLVEEKKTGTVKKWRYSFRFQGKQKTLGLGTYPTISLKEAREAHEELRDLVLKGVDPSGYRKMKDAQRVEEQGNTFLKIALEWYGVKESEWSDSHKYRVLRLLEKDIFPFLGGRIIDELEPPEVLQVFKRMEHRGVGYSAHKAKQVCGQVFRYGVAVGVCSRDPTADLKGALVAVRAAHFPAITNPKEIGGLMRAIDGYTGEFVTLCALKLIALVFTRSKELRLAEWSEFNFDESIWTIPAEKMKGGRVHKVPLSRQAVTVLMELQPLTGGGLVFPSVRSRARPMSENTINGALRRLGYSKEEMTGHGFRSMASTNLNEMGFNPDAIEAQLSHVDKNAVRSAYNRGTYWPERVEMMQHWADYLDSLKQGADVLPFRVKG